MDWWTNPDEGIFEGDSREIGLGHPETGPWSDNGNPGDVTRVGHTTRVVGYRRGSPDRGPTGSGVDLRGLEDRVADRSPSTHSVGLPLCHVRTLLRVRSTASLRRSGPGRCRLDAEKVLGGLWGTFTVDIVYRDNRQDGKDRLSRDKW